MKVTILNLALAAALLGVWGCSDLGKNKVVDRPIESQQFNAGCELKVDEFEFILEKDMSYQIDCLDRNLSLFMRVVESGRPGHLNRGAFEQYVIKYVPDFKPENVRAIKALFDISHLFFGGDPDYISPQAVRKIVDFAYLFNREAIKMYPLFSSTEENTSPNLHRIFRERVFNGALNISQGLLDIYVPERGPEIHKLDIIELLDAFSGAGTDTILDKVKAALFVKRLFLGGERQVITHVELFDLLNKLSPMSPIAYDLARLKYLELNQQAQMEMIKTDIERIEPLLYFTPDSSERLFSLTELAEALRQFTETRCKPEHTLPDGTVVAAEVLSNGKVCPPEGVVYSLPDLRKYPDQLLELKMILMSTEKWKADQDLSGREWVLPSELKMLIEHAKDITTRSATYHRIYEFFKTQLDSPASINLNYNNYLLQFPGHEKYVKEFARFTTSYRFFRGKFDSPYYSPAIRRNVEGYVELGALEYVLTMAFRRYGDSTRPANAPAPRPTDSDYCPGNQVTCLGHYGASQDQLLNVFNVFKKLLVDEDMITDGLEPRTNQNLTLLSTLFQYQSNGDGVINVNEMTELANTVITSFSVADYFHAEMQKLCAKDSRGRITDLKCYRREFMGVACKKYKQYYPKLFSSFGLSNCDASKERDWEEKSLPAVEKYLKTLEVVARTCTVFKDNTDVPMDDGDFMPIWVMMMNIEGTVSRYDVNGNNRMDSSEVRTAYRVAFHPAVEALVEQQAAVIAKLPFNLGSGISKKIYYYLIKYGSIPSSLKQYLKLIFIGASPANRQTIASVLKVIGEESPATVEFDCETLR